MKSLFNPYDFDNVESCVNYIIERTHFIKKSLCFVEFDSEHLTVRCPLSGEYLDIVGDTDSLNQINKTLEEGDWYREF